MKYSQIYANTYFWRTWQQQEIDWIEEREGKLFAYEFKYSSNAMKHKEAFLSQYPDSEVKVVNKSNYRDFIV